MITTVNPGSLLTLTGSFELLPDGDVIDRESFRVVVLHQLLRQFQYDPEDDVTGPIRITIEAAR